jgi:hypothetical protein
MLEQILIGKVFNPDPGQAFDGISKEKLALLSGRVSACMV